VGSPPPVISSSPTTPVGDLGSAILLRALVFEGKFCSGVVGSDLWILAPAPGNRYGLDDPAGRDPHYHRRNSLH